MNLEQRLELATRYLQNMLIMLAPKRTGNLSLNAIRIVQVAPNHWQIIVGGELAPYAIFTNEMWISPKWSGKMNPNQGWIERAIDYAKPTIKGLMSGKLEEVDMTNIQSEIQRQLDELYTKVDIGGSI